MLHSPHVAVRLQTWADKGRRKLEELLAKMGFRIKDCKLDFCDPPPPSNACVSPFALLSFTRRI